MPLPFFFLDPFKNSTSCRELVIQVLIIHRSAKWLFVLGCYGGKILRWPFAVWLFLDRCLFVPDRAWMTSFRNDSTQNLAWWKHEFIEVTYKSVGWKLLTGASIRWKSAQACDDSREQHYWSYLFNLHSVPLKSLLPPSNCLLLL